MSQHDQPIGAAEIGEAPQPDWTPVDDLDGPLEDGDTLNALDYPEPDDAYQPPENPDAEPEEEA